MSYQQYRYIGTYEQSGKPEHISRIRLFLIASGLVLIAGLLFTVFQSPVYRSSATVLMSAPVAVDAGVTEADVQNVAIQRRILLGSQITAGLVAVLRDAGWDVDSALLAEVLHVDPVEGTNLLEMSAQGADDGLLPVLVNDWIQVYTDLRADDIAQNKRQSMDQVEAELDELATKIEQTRDALDAFRMEHDIVSIEREENEVMSRLNGLNASLNAAVEEEIKARVYLQNIREMSAAGKSFVPASERDRLVELNSELSTLKVEYVEMSKRYTDDYISRDPALNKVPARIKDLEKQISGIMAAGQTAELEAAEQAHSASELTVKTLKQELADHKQSVADFNRIYGTHQSLVEDLARLEELHRDRQARLVQLEVNRIESFPQISVIEPASGSSERLGPDYLLLVGSSVAAALLTGIFAVWLHGFLWPKPQEPAHLTLTAGGPVYAQENLRGVALSADSRQQLGRDGLALDAPDDGGEEPDRERG